MEFRRALWGTTLLAFFNIHAPAAALYVDLNSTNPVPPYASWSSAATNIQDAVDASTNGDLILVTNGVYATGGRTVNGYALTNRVVIGKAVTAQSVNGPAETVIEGYQVPGTTNGNSAVRCVYMTNNAVLIGFTLAFGATLNAGDADHERSGGGVWCEGTNTELSNCILVSNSADLFVGGIYSGTLTNCTLAFNASESYYCGAAWKCALYNSRVTNNLDTAVFDCTLFNCLIADNPDEGANGSMLFNCTAVENGYAGADNCTVFNSIVCYNGFPNCIECRILNCCISSASVCTGSNNITNSPLFVDSAHGNYQLQVFSPCINAGTNFYAPSGSDLAGNPRIEGGTVDIGAFESDYTNLNFAGFHFVSINSTNPVAPYTNWLTAATNIQDAIAVAQPGETVIVGVGSYASGSYVVHGQEPNRVVITNAITLLGLSDLYWGTNMAGAIIVGGPGIRGVYVGSNAVLSGFEITNGYANNGSDPNYDQSGGGVWCETGGVVSNCLITRNYANDYGGGIYGGTVYGSAIVQNSANSGGGACSNVLDACTIQGNTAPSGLGAGVFGCTLNNCLIAGNSQTQRGGGAFQSTLTNCNLVGNSASFGGGAANSTLDDCMILSNSGSGTLMCTVANSSFVGNSSGDGGGALGGTLTNCILIGNSATYGGAAAGGYVYSVGTFPIILDNCVISSNTANYGGGVAVTGGFSTPQDYTNCVLDNCLLTSNSSDYGGAAYSVLLNNCTISSNSAIYGGGIEGGLLNNCILSYNLASSDGYFVSGGGADSTYPGPPGILNNCTLIGNVASAPLGGVGGGATGCTLNDCMILSNSAEGYISGGGTYYDNLSNCVLAYNSSQMSGGGDYGSTLINCTVISNSAPVGGGVYESILENCIIYYNAGGNYYQATLNHCCTTPLTNGLENITNEPAFVNLASGDFHLQSNSPCINSGKNAYVADATDLDGNLRIVGGTVDIGAYEYQTPTSVISYAWLLQYGLPTDGSVDYADLDGTGFNVYQDWVAGLNPTNALSVLALLPPVPTNNPAGLVVSWESVNNRTYFLQSSTNLAVHPAFSTIQSNIVGQPDTTSFMDTNAVGDGPFFYRVGVQQ